MKKPFILAGICMLFAACTSKIQIDQTIDSLPPITPDYTGVTVPVNIAPLHFGLADSCKATQLNAIFCSGDKRITVRGTHQIAPSASQWKELVQEADSIQVYLQAKKDNQWAEYAPFSIYVKKDKIDSHLAYRLIEPGYEIWNEMGIYQRCLENFDESAILAALEPRRMLDVRDTRGQRPAHLVHQLRQDGENGWLFIANGQNPVSPDVDPAPVLRFSLRGEYRLTETKTVSGQSLQAKPVFTGNLAGNRDLSFTVCNTNIVQLPFTGSQMSFIPFVPLMLCMGFLYIQNRKKEFKNQ